ncbi:MAG: carbohydrate-binding domain-containing protein [Coriobacteriales bacterium]
MNKGKLAAAMLLAALMIPIAGCSASSVSASGTSESDSGTTTTTSVSTSSNGMLDTSDIFTDRDLEQTADTSNATEYTVSDGEDIEITEEGVYVISGTASDVTIKVTADDTAKVQIVLNGVSITNTDSPVIYVTSADKVFVTTASGSENSLSVTGTFVADGDTNTDAVIFSKEDLTLNGQGTLTIDSTDNGITSKDDLKVTGGTYEITCSSDALEANDSIAIADGTFTITAGGDALHSEYDEDDTVGYVYIAGGTFNITASDDGIQGTTITQIDGGEFTIDAAEGIEATYVQINGGTIDITASDDGINAAQKSDSYATENGIVIEINDGDISITMGSGDTDAVDSNGSIYINGGTVDITANGAFDYLDTAELNGGTVTVNGEQVTTIESDMAGGGMGGGPGGDTQGGGMGGQSPSFGGSSSSNSINSTQSW